MRLSYNEKQENWYKVIDLSRLLVIADPENAEYWELKLDKGLSKIQK